MSIEFACPRCLHLQKVDESNVGQQFYCPVCYFKLTVPAESTRKPLDESQLYSLDTKPHDSQDRQELISFPCETCNTIIGVRKEQVGEEIACEECGKKIVVPKSITERTKAKLKDKLDQARTLMTPKTTYSLSKGITVPAKERGKSFRFSCGLCGTALFATKEQVGTFVLCHDCETKTEVPTQTLKSEPATLSPMAFEGTTAYNVASPSQPGAKKSSAVATQENLVPVVCHFCGTRMYAAEADIGQSKTCPDCGLQTEVKKVPKPRKITTETTPGDAYALNKASTTTPRHAAAFLARFSPARERKRLNESETYRSLERPPLPKRPFTERFFVPFGSPNTWLPLIVFVAAGLLGTILAILFVLFLPISFIIYIAAFCYFASLLVHLYGITSSGMDAGEFRGEVAPADYFTIGLWLFTFSFIATVPGFLLGRFFGAEILLIVVMMRISHWLFFPICFLSSMETGSMFDVLAKNTITSLFCQPFAWFRFYLLTGVLFILADGCLLGTLWLDSTMGSLFFVTLTFLFLLFAIQSLFYFRLLGRLAWLLEETDRRKREWEDEDDGE